MGDLIMTWPVFKSYENFFDEFDVITLEHQVETTKDYNKMSHERT